MSIYAILGATGQVGGSVLQVLSKEPSRQIRCFVRSKSKLESQCPEICASPKVEIFEGGITDHDTLTKCLCGTRAVFLTVAAFASKPGTRIAQDQAEAVVSALEILRKEGDGGLKLPTLIMLSSSEAEIEPKFSLSISWPIRKILFASNYYTYLDLIEAEKYLRARDWANVVYFKPGGISHDIQRGHTITEETQQTFVSFLDVAAGMIECADDSERWSGKCVSVLSSGKAKIEWSAPMHLFRGLLVYVIPSLHSWL